MKLVPLVLALAVAPPVDPTGAWDLPQEVELAARLNAVVREVGETASAPELEVAAWYAAVGDGPAWGLAAEREFLATDAPPPWIAETSDSEGRTTVARIAESLVRTLGEGAPVERTRLVDVRHALLGRGKTVRSTSSRVSWIAAGRWEHGSAAFDYVVSVRVRDESGGDTPHGWRALEAAEEELIHAARAACGLPAVEVYRFGRVFLPAAVDEPPRDVVPVGDGRVRGAFSAFVCGAVPGDTVADIGCGTGWAARELAKALGPTSRVIARDIDPSRIPARSGAENLEFARSSVDDVAIAPATLDRAYMEMVLHYVLRQESTQDAFAVSLLRAMKPGGRLFVIQHDSTGRPRDEEAAAGVELFARAGFEVGPRWRLHDGWNGRRRFLVLEFRRPIDPAADDR